MASTHPQFEALSRAGVDPAVVAALELAVRQAPDEELCRINPLHFAERHGLEEERTIAGFLHASKLGLFELTWNLLCPGCGGLLDAGSTLKAVKAHYDCSMCTVKLELTLDQLVEVSFTVNPGVRRIAAHQPEALPVTQYYRQLYFSPSLIMPVGKAWDAFTAEFMLAAEEVPAREKVILSLQVPAEPMILVFDPITHAISFVEVSGEPTRERQELSIVLAPSGASPVKASVRPGPLRLTLENKTDRRILPSLVVPNERLKSVLQFRPFLTAKQLFSNQTFRDLFRTETLEVDQRLKITSLTVLFTDLKGSTALYERVGDLVAYDVVRAHFRVLEDAVRTAGGAVVKTIGDAVMATFPTAERGVACALKMRESMDRLNEERKHEDLLVKIGLHEGPCLAVMSNERLDYFGQTVNIAARVQGLAQSRSIFTTEPVVKNGGVSALLRAKQLSPQPQRAVLKGIKDELTVYEIP